MNKPLKNKIKNDIEADYEGTCIDHKAFDKEDVKSAVEWLKENVITRHNWTKNQMCKLISEAFPDLCPSGDLIADKQNPQDTYSDLRNDYELGNK